jgi:hypothetical protein
VHIRPPVWTLKKLCPVCGQGSCLVFVACPGCNHLAIECDEEGSIFLNPRDLSLASHEPSTALCPGCSSHLVASFPVATDASIQAAGFTVTEYE